MSKMRAAQSGNVDPGKGIFDKSETIDVTDLFGALRRRIWMILAISIIGGVIGGLIGKSIAPTYTAESAVLIEPVDNPAIDVQAMIRGMTADQTTIATQIQLLRSRTYLARVMEDMSLFEDPEFNPALIEETPLLDRFPFNYLRRPIDEISAMLPQQWLIDMGLMQGEMPVIDSEVARLSRERAISIFADNLRLFNDGTSYVISISFIASTPEKAARIANRIAELYVAEQLEAKILATGRTSTFYQERLHELEDEVRLAEEAVVRYETSIGFDNGDGTTLNQQELSSINAEVINLRGDLAEKQAKLALVRNLRASGGDLGTIGDVAQSGLITSLRQQETELLRREAEYRSLYGPRHPRMLDLQQEKAELDAKIDAEVQRIAATLQNDVQVASTRLASLEAQLADVRSATSVDRASEVRLNELQRKADTSRRAYEDFLERSKTLEENQELVQPDVRIILNAKPPTKPSSPGSKIFAGAAFTLFFIFASIFAIVRERMDSGIRSPREVEKLLGLNTLGMIPHLTRLRRNQKPYQYLMDKPLSAYAEAIRGIYMAVKLSNVDKQPKVVLVTSSLPDEGKTTLALSLATFAARSHKRVLLIDLDLRHPSVHQELGWQVSGGLVEYMAGDRPLDEIIHHDLETGLHFLPIKGQTTNPTELLDSQRMRQLIDMCREAYDYIVLDSAPVTSVTDTRVAALLADRTIFAVRWGTTVASAAENSVQTLRDVGIEPVGAVITQIDLKRHAQYGYGDMGQYYSKSQKYYVN
ncbi:MAG: Wzz/FepE/Etk N-terminal domain-containing protein [Geminicoccaceae bacterium]|nr:AAA family ATPase [Geminicoccaceae bacterium]